MTKEQIVRKLAERHKVAQHKVKRIINSLFAVIRGEVIKKGKIEFRGLGTFYTLREKGKKSNLPGLEDMPVKPRTMVKFRPVKDWIDKLNKRKGKNNG